MLIHSVYFWLRKDLTPDERALFDRELRQLTKITYLAAAFIGPPAPTAKRPVIDHTFDYAAALHFKSLQDHDFYQADCPDHARFVNTCKPLWERVVIYDVAMME